MTNGAEWQLVVVLPQGPLRVRLRAGTEVVLGRAPPCEVLLEDSSLSRRHAAFRVRERAYVRDLGSANGTWLRGRSESADTAQMQDVRLAEGAEHCLSAGDTLVLGSVTVLVQRVAARTESMLAQDPSMQSVLELASRVATTPLSVLLLGETGTGKEELARFLHRSSPRAEGPFVALNCAAMPESLLESELFGHVRGAFTGAHQDKRGLFEEAHGGSLLLDELGDLPLPLQAKLLRVLEERAVRPVGSNHARPVDVRVLAATLRDLEALSREGRFRTDLYFRLNGITLQLPALRDRPGDLEPLAAHFLTEAALRFGRATAPALGPEALAALRAYAWPGNVRELRNVIERAVALSTGAAIDAAALRLQAPSPAAPAPPATAPPARLPEELGALERKRILEALERAAGNQTLAAELLGISRRTLLTRLDEYGVPRPRKR